MMDLLKQCSTTVYRIQGYSNIQYRVYEMSAASLAKHMRPNENIIQGEPSLENNVRTQAIRSTEWTLRRNGLLVAANAQMQLWLFGTSQEYLNERLQACGHITESSFGIDGNPEFKCMSSSGGSA